MSDSTLFIVGAFVTAIALVSTLLALLMPTKESMRQPSPVTEPVNGRPAKTVVNHQSQPSTTGGARIRWS